MQIQVGKTYATRSTGELIKIIGEDGDGLFAGRVVGENEARAFLRTGERASGDYCQPGDLVSEVIAGYAEFKALGSYDKDAVRRIVGAFRDKKITGIKILRKQFNLGLLEAKNMFEGVAASTL